LPFSGLPDGYLLERTFNPKTHFRDKKTRQITTEISLASNANLLPWEKFAGLRESPNTPEYLCGRQNKRSKKERSK